MNDYDEDLLQNPFYKALITKGKQLYEDAAEQRKTICIPRKGTTSRSHFTKEQFENHILRQQNENGDVYITDNEKEVKINGNFIVATKGFNEFRSVQILFDETFFNKNEEGYHVLCIDQLIAGSAFSTPAQPVIQSLETLDNCVEFLWAGNTNRKARHQINEVIHLFNSTYTRLMSESIRHTMDATNAVFSRAMQICLREAHLRRPALSNKMFMDNLKVAIETYVMDGMFEKVFKGISSFLSDEDAVFNKTTRNLADLQMNDLNVNKVLSKNIAKAKKILVQLNQFKTPLEKFHVLKFTITKLSEAPKTSPGEGVVPITADDLLPALVFLVVKTDIPNWLANLTYLKNFHFSRAKSDEFQFYLSTTEAAIEHVKTGRLDALISMTHIQRLRTASSLFQTLGSPEKRTNEPSPVEYFFEKIREGNTAEVLKILQHSATSMKEVNQSLCHPLCSCDKCDRLVTSKRKDPYAVTVFSRDELGCTGLHQAAEFGSEECIYELIKKGAVPNSTNYLGSTPLHLACHRGHHKTAVLLTHYGADRNVVDNAGNTPLHLAVENCHEIVVDYLCSDECGVSCKLDLHLDIQNEHGDTSLHIASRWGFGRLVYLLLEKGASTTLKNKKGLMPQESALNSKIKGIFLRDSQSENKEEGYIYLPPSPTLDLRERQNSIEDAIKSEVDGPVSQPSNRKKKEFRNVLKAIANGDTATVREKLGIPAENDSGPSLSYETIEASLCHPLCQCSNCQTLLKKVPSEYSCINVNTSNEDGVTPLHAASLHGLEDIVSLLVNKANADTNLKTKVNQRTPLHLAAQYNHVQCVSLLLKGGARVDLKDSNGNTPLHFACANGHTGPAILLLQSGADMNIQNHRGNTSLHDAARWSFADICNLLLHYGSPLDIRNRMNMTPRQYASNNDIQELLRKAENLVSVESLPEKDIKKTAKTKSNLNFTDDTDPSLFSRKQTRLQHANKTPILTTTTTQHGSQPVIDPITKTDSQKFKNPEKCTVQSSDKQKTENRKDVLEITTESAAKNVTIVCSSDFSTTTAKVTTTAPTTFETRDISDTTAFSSATRPTTDSSTKQIRTTENYNLPSSIEKKTKIPKDNQAISVVEEHLTAAGSVSDLFAALEERNVTMLKEIAAGVKTFDRKRSLKRTSTIDKSSAWLNTRLKTMLSIKTFDQSSLKAAVGDHETVTVSTISDLESLPDDLTGSTSDEDFETGLKNSLMPGTPDLEKVKILDDISENDDDVMRGEGNKRDSQFEDWFENEVQSDSADEELEDSIHVCIEGEFDDCDYKLNSVSQLNNERMKELLNDAMCETEKPKPKFKSSETVVKTLSQDDDIFEGRHQRKH